MYPVVEEIDHLNNDMVGVYAYERHLNHYLEQQLAGQQSSYKGMQYEDADPDRPSTFDK